MSQGLKRYRSNRADLIGLPPGLIGRVWASLQQSSVLIRLGLCLVAGFLMWAITGAWAPPFSYRSGFVPPRDVMARVKFQLKNEQQTLDEQRNRRRELPCVYEQNSKKLEEIRQELKNKVFEVLRTESFEQLSPDIKREFGALSADPMSTMELTAFDACRAALANDKELANFDAALKRVFLPLEQNGILEKLQHKPDEGSQAAVFIRPQGRDRWTHQVNIDDVRLEKVRAKLPTSLAAELKAGGFAPEQTDAVTAFIVPWLQLRLPLTLNYDSALSAREAEKAIAEVKPVLDTFTPGVSRLAEAGQPLGENEMKLLRYEYQAWRNSLTIAQLAAHSLATFGMYLALYTLCGFYIANRKPVILQNLGKFTTLLSVAVAAVALCWFSAGDQWRAELIPLLLFGMTVAIAFEKELALLLASSVSLIVAFSLEQGLAEFVILVSSVASSILMLGRIRSRTKLIYVGAVSGVVVTATAIGVGTLVGQSFGPAAIPLAAAGLEVQQLDQTSYLTILTAGALWFGFCSILAGLLMTGLLPFIERMFDVQTDISLLELADIAHPLLQELVRRAPGTYNHSINVASIAETAAEAIGANGLLVRVGAYFHDIGKMLKPGYFVENQGPEGNRHDSLLPAMSTLVIIAHVKDGAELARKHQLPHSLIDFIEQHHGTTLVEYFYRRAAKLNEEDPDAAEVDEANFRYPGPKPQTKETAVLMLADVVESSSRALSDPTPARIESLVHDMAMKRLLDGQFDECGLTLQELHTIEESLVKSLTAVYHGRVKYPEQQAV